MTFWQSSGVVRLILMCGVLFIGFFGCVILSCRKLPCQYSANTCRRHNKTDPYFVEFEVMKTVAMMCRMPVCSIDGSLYTVMWHPSNLVCFTVASLHAVSAMNSYSFVQTRLIKLGTTPIPSDFLPLPSLFNALPLLIVAWLEV